MRACLVCGRPTPTGSRCNLHAKTMNYRSGSYWRKLRQRRLNLDGHRCQLHHPGCTQVATTVHLDPALNGDHLYATLGNTISACLHCHGVEDAPRASGQPAWSRSRS